MKHSAAALTAAASHRRGRGNPAQAHAPYCGIRWGSLPEDSYAGGSGRITDEPAWNRRRLPCSKGDCISCLHHDGSTVRPGPGRSGCARTGCVSIRRSPSSRARRHVGALLDVNPATMRNWIEQGEVGAGQRPGVTSEASAELKALRKENAELRRANKILRTASAFLAAAEVDRRHHEPSQRGRMRSGRSVLARLWAVTARRPPRVSRPVQVQEPDQDRSGWESGSRWSTPTAMSGHTRADRIAAGEASVVGRVG